MSDRFSAGHSPQSRSVLLTTPTGEVYHLKEDEAGALRDEILAAIWKIRAQKRGDAKKAAARKKGA